MTARITVKSSLSSEANHIRRLFLAGQKKNLWSTVLDCVRKTGIGPGALERHMNDRFENKNRRKRFQEGTIKTLEQYLRKREVKIPERRAMTTVGKPPPEVPLVESPAVELNFDWLMAGLVQLRGQSMDGVRFVITADSIQKLDPQGKKVREEDVKDTILLLQELRRRLNIFAQLGDLDDRRELFQALAPEIDFFYVATQQLSQVCPTGAAAHIDEMERSRHGAKGLFNP
ncbi:hypothetical protein KKC44_05820, partial [Patescibacteria group bacterium]|nr:hypothetical protein [Patescibacteria group bacterium]